MSAAGLSPVDHRVTKREVVWAITVSVLLVAGIVGTLLLQTAMQGQARTLQLQHDHTAALITRSQLLQRGLDRFAAPTALAARARSLHMRPQGRPRFLLARAAVSRGE